MTAAPVSERSALMRVVVARAKIDEALSRALIIAVDLENTKRPDGFDRDVAIACTKLIDEYVLKASRHLQEFQEAVHGA